MTTIANNNDQLLGAVKILLLIIIACAVGIGAWVVIGAVTGVEAWDHRYYWMFGYPLLLATSLVTAYIDSRRPWVWGILPLFAQAVYTLYDIKYQAVVLPLTVLLYVVLIAPGIVVAYVGIRLRRRMRSRRA